MKIKYPTRCRIVDVNGQTFHGIKIRTPDKSYPHLGKYGLAELEDGLVKITLDDGNIIYGYECWWIPINENSKI